MPVNWEEIRNLYRTAQLSNVAIGKKHGVNESAIRKRAKKEGWEKDLSPEVKRRIREKLDRSESEGKEKGDLGRTSTHEDNDDAIIEEAAKRGVEVITLHRKDIAKQRAIAQALLEELVRNPKKTVFIGKGKDRKALEVDLSLKEKSKVLLNLSLAVSRYIPLERQAFNLDDHAGDDNIPDSLQITFNREITYNNCQKT
jgi:hypothetical protein